MASFIKHLVDRSLEQLDPFLKFHDIGNTFIVFLLNKREPVDFADTMIVSVVSFLSLPIASAHNIAIDEVLLVSLLDPLALFEQVKQELPREEPFIYRVVDADGLISGATLAHYQSPYVCLNQIGHEVDRVDGDRAIERIELQTLIVSFLFT